MVESGRPQLNDDRAAVNSTIITDGAYAETAETSCLAVICDGVGDGQYGNEAAEIVTDIFSRLSGTHLTADIIIEYVATANDAVINAQKSDFKRSKMSTTIAGLYINEDDFIAFNVGDSRIYRYRSCISRISRDHSLKQEQIDLGIEPKPGQENVITRYIGGTRAVPEIVDGTGRVFKDDVFIICSDGVWGALDDDDFERILSQEDGGDEVCRTLIDLAFQKGSKDNLSVIIIRRV